MGFINFGNDKEDIACLTEDVLRQGKAKLRALAALRTACKRLELHGVDTDGMSKMTLQELEGYLEGLDR
jgi:hypothetical protein